MSGRVLAIALGGVGLIHALLFLGIILDDAYISFRYARNLADGNGLVFNVGERVEGYTNFLWTLIAAVPHLLDVSSARVMPLLGLGCLVALVVILLRSARGVEREPREGLDWAGIPTLIIFGATTGIAFYAVSGLETLLYALLFTSATLALIGGRPVLFAVLTSLAFLTRPEAALLGIAGAITLGFDPSRPRATRIRAAVVSLLAFAVCLGPYVAWKLWYFGSLLPNTIHAKPPDWWAGATYLLGALLPAAGILLVVLLRPLRGTPLSRRQWILLAVFGAQAVGVVLEGGDWMPVDRFFVPYVGLLALAFDEAIARGFSGARRPPRWRQAVFGVVVAAYVGTNLAATIDTLGEFRDYARLDTLRAAVAASLTEDHQPATVGLYDIGLTGYLMQEARIIDFGGLVDPVLARAPLTHPIDEAAIGYLEQRAPDLILITSWSVERHPRNGTFRMEPRYGPEQGIVFSSWFARWYDHQAVIPMSGNYAVQVFERRASPRAPDGARQLPPYYVFDPPAGQ